MRIKLVSLLSSYFRGLIVSEVVSIGRTLFITATEPYPPILLIELYHQIEFPFHLDLDLDHFSYFER